jgi:hypothetical protein
MGDRYYYSLCGLSVGLALIQIKQMLIRIDADLYRQPGWQ